MKETLEVLTAAEACDMATDVHVMRVSKQIKRIMRAIHYRAKHGHFDIKCFDIYEEVRQYLTSIGYNVKTYIDLDDNCITLIQ